MSATGQPYSDAALTVAKRAIADLQTLPAGELSWQDFDRSERATMTADATAALDAAHDREALGLDASVHAASYRREVIEEVAAWLRRNDPERQCSIGGEAGRIGSRLADLLLREFEATEAKP